ncbi:MAG: hypothetical protein ACRDZY_06215 [Acidimicrobiales bacterium]
MSQVPTTTEPAQPAPAQPAPAQPAQAEVPALPRPAGGPITRADIEAKLRQISDQVTRTTEAAKPNLMAIGAAAAVGLVVLAYVFGKRKGRRRSTVVEIRRV